MHTHTLVSTPIEDYYIKITKRGHLCYTHTHARTHTEASTHIHDTHTHAVVSTPDRRKQYTDGDFWRREHHGMFLSRGLKWYWGTYILPEISFQTPRYWEHSEMFPTTKSPSDILYGYTHCLARLRHSSQKFTKLRIFFQRGFSLKM